jgi:hypothetical protein
MGGLCACSTPLSNTEVYHHGTPRDGHAVSRRGRRGRCRECPHCGLRNPPGTPFRYEICSSCRRQVMPCLRRAIRSWHEARESVGVIDVILGSGRCRHGATSEAPGYSVSSLLEAYWGHSRPLSCSRALSSGSSCATGFPNPEQGTGSGCGSRQHYRCSPARAAASGATNRREDGVIAFGAPQVMRHQRAARAGSAVRCLPLRHPNGTGTAP